MEEETIAPDNSPAPELAKEEKPSVYVLRDWKEYVGESFLIIFSVFLALVATEFINSLHEKKETRELLENIRQELITNKQHEAEQLAYHLSIIKSIDSALTNPAMQRQIVSGDEFHLTRIAPHGVLFHYLYDVAWQVAKSHNISSRIKFKTVADLTYLYEDQARIMKVEDEIAKVFLSRDAGKIENAHATLIMIKNNYRGWAVDRAPGLLKQYDDVIKALGEGELSRKSNFGVFCLCWCCHQQQGCLLGFANDEAHSLQVNLKTAKGQICENDMKLLMILLIGYILLCAMIPVKHGISSQPDYTLGSDTLKGKVKYCIQFEYETYRDSGEIDSSYVFKMVSQYNSHGKIESFRMINPRAENDCNFCFFYSYDKMGRELLVKDISDGIMDSNSYTVNKENNLVEIMYSDAKRIHLKIIYNRQGQRDTMYDYNYGGGYMGKTIYHYDKNKDLIEQLSLDSTGRLNHRETYSYDNNHNKITDIRYDSLGIRTSRETHAYDEHGCMVMETDSNTFYMGGFGVYDNLTEGKIHIRAFHFTNFDKNGNWLQEDALLNGKAVKTVKRKIEYY